MIPDVIVVSRPEGVVHEAGTVNVPPDKVSLLFEPEPETVVFVISKVAVLLVILKSPALLMFRVSTVHVVEEGMAVPSLVLELLSIVRVLEVSSEISVVPFEFAIYTVPAPPS